MIEIKMAEAANALAKIQLGLNKKDNLDDSQKMPPIFTQISDVFKDELMEQLKKISANMKQKYKLANVSVKTLEIIADEIKDRAENDRIQSLSTLSQDEEILKIAEKAAEKQIKDETEGPVEENVVLPQEEIVPKENKPVEQVMSELGAPTETQNQIYGLFSSMTRENVADVRTRIREKMDSEEYKAERKAFEEKAAYIMENGTETQKQQTFNELKRMRDYDRRRRMSPEERKLKRAQVNSQFFGLLELTLNEGFSFEYIRGKISEFVAEEVAFEDNEVFDMQRLIVNCRTREDFQRVLLDKMVDIRKESGELPKSEAEMKKELLEIAKKKMTTKDQRGSGLETDKNKEKTLQYYDQVMHGRKNVNDTSWFYSEENSSIDAELAESYASLYLSPEDSVRLNNLLEHLDKKESDLYFPLDFSIMNKIKKIDKNFYFLTLRQIKEMSERNGNENVIKNVEEIIDKEIREQSSTVSREILVRQRQKLTPEEQQTKRKGITGILQTFLVESVHSTKGLEDRKNEILKYIRNEHGLSEEEKVELYNSLTEAQSNEEFQYAILDKMESLVAESGRKIDKERVLNTAKKDREKTSVLLVISRAKIVFDDQLYNQFLDFYDDFSKGIPDGVEKDYDYACLDLIKQKDSVVYETLKSRIKDVMEIRKDDKKLKRLYERLEYGDRTDADWVNAAKEDNASNANQIEEAVNNKKRMLDENIAYGDTSKTSVALFDFITEIYDENADISFEDIKNSIFDYISNDTVFSVEETEELLTQIVNADMKNRLGEILSEKMVELAEKRGIPPKSLLPNQIRGLAKETTLTKNVREDANIEKRSLMLDKVYAKMFLTNEERNRANNLIFQMSDTQKNVTYDFSILDRIKDLDENFYYSMIRSVGVLADKTGKPELKDKYNELVSKELLEKNYNELDDLGKIDTRAKIVLDIGVYNRYKKLEEGILNGSHDGVYDETIIEYIKVKDLSVYTMLMNQMKEAAKDRDDQDLFGVIEKFESTTTNKTENNLEQEDKKPGPVLMVENLTVDDIVTTHADGLDMFKENKSKSTDDTSSEGR